MENKQIKPQRIQLSRKKGFNLQEYSKNLNGLECVKCDRSTKWGNPFKIISNKGSFGILKGKTLELLKYGTTRQEAIERSIKLFEKMIRNNDKRIKNILPEDMDFSIFLDRNNFKFCGSHLDVNSLKSGKYLDTIYYKYWDRIRMEQINIVFTTAYIKKELKGKNLACWCKEGEPCHCDILLKIANEE